ncbi:MAG: NAD-dependent epimerase/dehydratase family protein [Candidatus Caldatribacteriaceae bacterium]
MAEILVTGGAGFIGSWVVDYYIREGFTVAVVDNLSTGNMKNLDPRASFYPVDITAKADLQEVFDREKPRYVNHHAAQINLRRSVEDPLFDASVNILGSLNVLELSVYHRVQRIVFASTGGAIYGEVETLPVGEDTLPQPLSPYGVAKFSVENYLEYYRKVWGLEYVALRYANVYGPRQNPEGEAGVIAIFSSQILQGKPCIVFGDGRKTRDYVYVEDIARANILALSSPSGVYNLGTGKETSVLELLELFQQVSAKKVHCSFSTERKGEVNRIALSFAKAQKILSWSPQVELSEGMRRTFFWLAEQFS